MGRGTRLRPDLFGPGRDKKYFQIFDYCQNLEFFSQNPETTSGAAGDSLSKKLFANRVELIAELDKHGIRGAPLSVEPNSDELAEISKLIDQKKIKVIISQVLPLSDAAKAQAQTDTHHTRGKVVLKVAEER